MTAVVLSTRPPHDRGQQDEALHRAPGTRTSEQLLRIADHLTRHRPTAPMTEAARMTLALHTAGTADTARPLLRLMPWITTDLTRGEYALHLRRTAHMVGRKPVAESDQNPTSAKCPTCNGSGGQVEDTSNGGITRKTWKTCTTCHGTGTV